MMTAHKLEGDSTLKPPVMSSSEQRNKIQAHAAVQKAALRDSFAHPHKVRVAGRPAELGGSITS